MAKRGTAQGVAVRRYIEQLRIRQGPRAGQKFKLLGWQRDFVYGLFRRGVYSAALTVGRGNGKSALVGAIAAAALDCEDIAVPASDVVIVAGSLDQARIAFRHATGYLRDRIEDEGRPVWRLTDSHQRCELRHLPSGSRIIAKSSDPDLAHGLAPSLVLMDEPARWKRSRSDAMLTAMDTALGKQAHGKIIALGTRSGDPEHWFEQWCAGAADCIARYAYDGPIEEILTDEAIAAANPSLGHMPALRDKILAEVASIRRTNSPMELAAYRALRLNQGLPDVGRESLLAPEVWDACQVDEDALPPASGPHCWGVDLSGGAAMSAIAAYWPETGRLECFAVLPEEPDLLTKGAQDGVDRLYLEMQDRHELWCSPGWTIDVAAMMHHAYRTWGLPAAVCSDRWRERDLQNGLVQAGIPLPYWSPRGQGYHDQSDDVRLFERACLEGRVKAAHSLLLTAAIAGAVTMSNLAGDRKVAKGSAGQRVAKHRDDAAVAAMLAVAEGMRAYAGGSPIPAPEEEDEDDDPGWGIA